MTNFINNEVNTTLTPEQAANFAYWLIETNTHRGADAYKGKEKVSFIQFLIERFFDKYPCGILTGWNEDRKNELDQAAHEINEHLEL